jgi:hypothetical protein
MTDHSRECAADPAATLAAVARVADEWGGEFERQGGGGRLLLPVVAGLRRGWVRGRLAATPAGEGTRLALAVEEAAYHLHSASVAVLLLALAGSLVTVLWPLFPRLLEVAPLGAALALAAWLLVIARLKNSGPEEFLAQVAAAGGEASDPGGPSRL